MKKYLIIMILLFFITPVFARSIPNIPNEVKDPWFLDIPNNWYTLGDYTLIPNGVYLPGYTIDPGRNKDDAVLLSTVIDNASSPGWNPNYNLKEIDFSFIGHIDGGNMIIVLRYWDLIDIPQPPIDPYDETYPYPYNWTYVANSDLDVFTIRDDLLKPGEILPPGYHIYNTDFYLSSQPRWLLIELYLYIDEPVGGEMLFTGLDIETRCVGEPIPEPITIFLFGFSLLALFFKKGKS